MYFYISGDCKMHVNFRAIFPLDFLCKSWIRQFQYVKLWDGALHPM